MHGELCSCLSLIFPRYDSHREAILRGKNPAEGTDSDDEVSRLTPDTWLILLQEEQTMNLWPFFSSSCYKGFGSDDLVRKTCAIGSRRCLSGSLGLLRCVQGSVFIDRRGREGRDPRPRAPSFVWGCKDLVLYFVARHSALPFFAEATNCWNSIVPGKITLLTVPLDGLSNGNSATHQIDSTMLACTVPRIDCLDRYRRAMEKDNKKKRDKKRKEFTELVRVRTIPRYCFCPH